MILRTHRACAERLIWIRTKNKINRNFTCHLFLSDDNRQNRHLKYESRIDDICLLLYIDSRQLKTINV